MPEAYVDAPLDLDPDEIVEGVQRGDRRPQDLITLRGFVGESDVPDHHRLFTNPSLTCWVDIADCDIRYRRRIVDEDDPFGASSTVWVKKDAKLLKGEVTTAECEASFLSGAYAADAPWTIDDGLDCATHAPKYALARMASPNPTPQGPGCCQ